MKNSKKNSRNKLWEQRKKDKICVYCGCNSIRSEDTIGCIECLNKKVKSQTKSGKNNKDRQVLYRKRIKKIVIDKYGGKCACCNETELLFLTIDHINNDGHIERKSMAKGRNTVCSTQLYLKLKREEKRNDIQVLCFNCNLGRSLNNGICPHHKPALECYYPKDDLRTKGNYDINCKIEWPENNILITQINELGIGKVSKLLNIHKDSIRNRLKRRNLYHLIKKRKNQHG